MFPRIDRPCPYADRLAQVMDGDYCRMCKRTVFDLGAMDESARRAFLSGCAGEEICVRYTVRPALAAAALAASVIALPAFAQQAPAPDSAPAAVDEDADVIVVGGARLIPRAELTTTEPVRLLSTEVITDPGPLKRASQKPRHNRR